MESWDEDLINAKYHFAVAERMYANFFEFEEKRFLIGVINELAKSVSCFIRAVLIFEGKLGRNYSHNLKIFKKISRKYFGEIDSENLLKVLEIKRAHKMTPVEFAHKNKMILLVNGKYWFLTVERLGEFLKSLKNSILKFRGISDKYKKVI